MGIARVLPEDATAAAAARRLVEEVVAQGALREDALIVVSELVANAWRHGEPPILLELSLDAEGHPPGSLLISVSNRRGSDSRLVPRLMVGGRTDGLGGRGIGLVAALAQDWGWQEADGSLTVWAQVGPPRSLDR